MDQLIAQLKKIERQTYRAYQQIKGRYAFSDFELLIDTVQSDPYAASSRLRAIRPWALTGLTELQQQSLAYQRGARDFIARRFAEQIKHEPNVDVTISEQTILDSTAVLFNDSGIELRFRVSLPAEGRTVLGKKAINLLTHHLPKWIRKATAKLELDLEALHLHCQTVENQAALRAQLKQHQLVAFVANDSVLPRLAGDSELPMKDAVTFQSPASLSVTLETPHNGPMTGMGIPEGVTLFVGGGFHGKTTLLSALQKSIYDHIPGDGREYVVMDESAMKIRAEDGRAVHQLNLSNYIKSLPHGIKTDCFSSQDASGSTSQAAALQEAVESGCQAVLIDEDSSATNFMIRDERMQALIHRDAEPITPFVDRVRDLYQHCGVSSLIVMGGSGDYLDVADCVIQMHEYQAFDVTETAKQVVSDYPSKRQSETDGQFVTPSPRSFNSRALMKILQEGKFRVGNKGHNQLRLGQTIVNLAALEQIDSGAEINAIAWCLFQLAQQQQWLNEPVQSVDALLNQDWYQSLPPHGDLAKPRRCDVMAALNRCRDSQFKAG
ncbi:MULTISPECIES: ABC-ATPase domain-containing protein [unclassified Vibrio]|uniref:P-loop domain-containing protein n=1 Tax=Vibrio sp. HB236076 TaxID=3232307 RepID=A0AB39HJV9_9VIBR|nr:ABC-ATPase domain-containing protein [Vibrio sp. HB161653]MDP5252989.1 ABC-ATPase domain-containing protein [Vibrio sp. HB161653]